MRGERQKREENGVGPKQTVGRRPEGKQKLEQCSQSNKTENDRRAKALFHVINFIEAGLANYEFHFSLCFLLFSGCNVLIHSHISSYIRFGNKL